MKIAKEFREFIARGNVVDMAVGIIIGAAFTSIVTALIDNIVNPFIVLITGGNGTEVSGLRIPVAGTENGIDFGAFIGAILNFLIIAFIVFLMVKAFNNMRDVGVKLKNKDGVEVEEKAPTCPFCLEEVLEGSTRCPHCTAEFESPAKPEVVPLDK